MVSEKLKPTAYIPILFVCLLAVDAMGQGTRQATVTGQIRHRSERSGKDFDADQDNITFHLLRTRLNVTAVPTEDVTAFIQLQDSRVFGSETNTLTDGDADAFDAHQAYFQVANLFNSNLLVRIGRQEISVGNQRLMGAVGWHNIGRSLDGMRIFYEVEGGSLQLFAAKLVGASNLATGENLYGVVGTIPLSDDHSIEVTGLLDNDTEKISVGPAEGEMMLSRYTVGATLRGVSGTVDYEVEAFMQGGDQARGAAERASIAGTLLSARAGLLVVERSNAKIGGLVTLVSGDKDSSDNKYGAFNTLFATNHKFYGYMDYFLSFGGANGMGLRDFSIFAAVNASNDFRISIDLHKFSADQTPAGTSNDFGTEIDLTGVYLYNSAFSFSIGVSMFSPGDLMSASGGEDNAFWAYLMTVVNL